MTILKRIFRRNTNPSPVLDETLYSQIPINIVSDELFVKWVDSFMLGWTNLRFEEWSLLKEVYENDNTGKTI